MASTRRKAAAIAIAVIGVAGLSLAAAAQLTVNNTNLQAGSTTIDAACDGDGAVAMDYDYAYIAGTGASIGTGAYVLSAVNVTGVDSACANKTIGVTLVSESGSTVTLAGKTIAGTTGDVTVSWTSAATELSTATIASIFNVAVVIHD